MLHLRVNVFHETWSEHYATEGFHNVILSFSAMNNNHKAKAQIFLGECVT
jgi:hypothetical protein